MFFHVFAQTTHVVAAPHGFACVVIPATRLYVSSFIEIRSRVSEPQGVKIWPFPLLWLVAFTTACTTVQAVTSRDNRHMSPPSDVSALPVGGSEPDLIRGSFDPRESTPNGISIGSADSRLLHSSSVCQTHTHTHTHTTDRATCDICSKRPHLCTACRRNPNPIDDTPVAYSDRCDAELWTSVSVHYRTSATPRRTADRLLWSVLQQCNYINISRANRCSLSE